MSSAKKYPLVMVVWRDAFSTDAWTEVEKLDRGHLLCTTVGFDVSHDLRTYTIAGTLSSDGKACCTIHIPVACLVSYTRIQDKR